MSPYPAAPPGHSAHEYGYAFDMIVSPLSDLISAGEYWESLGGIWGGRIGDEVHFEYPGFKVALGTTIDVAQGLDDQSNNPVARAVKALHDLPWYLALLVPEKLLLTERNENMEQWAADVFAWIRKHS